MRRLPPPRPARRRMWPIPAASRADSRAFRGWPSYSYFVACLATFAGLKYSASKVLVAVSVSSLFIAMTR